MPLELTKKREEWKKERKKRKGKELRVHKCILHKEEKTKYLRVEKGWIRGNCETILKQRDNNYEKGGKRVKKRKEESKIRA